jgi:hypothetical protein
MVAAGLMSKAGVVSKGYAGAVTTQELRIATENAAIQKAGGEPNPSKAGKNRMFIVWGAYMGRIAETVLRHRGHEKAAKFTAGLALGAETVSLGMGEHVIHGYRQQRKDLKTK